MPTDPISLGSRGGSTQEERVPYVKQHYGRLWDATYEKAAALLAAGETSLARIHQMMRRDSGAEFADPELAEKYRRKDEQRRRMGFVLDRQVVQLHEAGNAVATRITDAVKMQELIAACADGIGRVIETGAGWGKGLFNLWLHGGPRDAQYIALELTEAGRKTTELIARSAAPGMKIEVRPFDYFQPDFSFLTEPVPTLVFSHHSIEQMPAMQESYFESVLAIPGFRRCVHLEPVGWQVPGEAWLAKPHPRRLMRRIDRLNREFSEQKNQNRNLYPLLADLERRGRIRITAVRKHLCSTLLPNATTLIIWESASAPAPARVAGDADDRRDDRRLSRAEPTGIAFEEEPPRKRKGRLSKLLRRLRPKKS